MNARAERARSVSQRVGNRGRDLGLSRKDTFTAYAMDRLLHRLGTSRHAGEFYLKGGILVANLLDIPHRFTRDIDFLYRHGPPDPAALRTKFQSLAALVGDDGIRFVPGDVHARLATRDLEGYDGVKVTMKAHVGPNAIDVSIDIGFGDAVVPPATRTPLKPFLPGDPPAQVYAYHVGPVLAEKIETLLSRFPEIEHRLKDILDVVTLSEREAFTGEYLVASLAATFERRRTVLDPQVVDDMLEELRGKQWETVWATMCKDKAVARTMNLRDAVAKFARFTRPPLAAARDGGSPGDWTPNGAWSVR